MKEVLLLLVKKRSRVPYVSLLSEGPSSDSGIYGRISQKCVLIEAIFIISVNVRSENA